MIRIVAAFEAAKGLLVLAAGIGALTFLHQNFRLLVTRLISHLHLNPARHYPRVFIDAAASLTDARLWLLAGLALLYALIRFVEAYGLWQGKRWAEWFAVLSGGIYIPFELSGLLADVSLLSLVMLLANTVIVVLMAYYLKRRDR